MILKIITFEGKKIYDKFFAERNNEINTWNNKFKYEETKYQFKSVYRISISVNSCNHSLCLIRNIADGTIDLEKKKKKNLDQN